MEYVSELIRGRGRGRGLWVLRSGGWEGERGYMEEMEGIFLMMHGRKLLDRVLGWTEHVSDRYLIWMCPANA